MPTWFTAYWEPSIISKVLDNCMTIHMHLLLFYTQAEENTYICLPGIWFSFDPLIHHCLAQDSSCHMHRLPHMAPSLAPLYLYSYTFSHFIMFTTITDCNNYSGVKVWSLWIFYIIIVIYLLSCFLSNFMLCAEVSI